MRVYNLSDTVQVYRGRYLKPHGGYADFDLSYIPERDLANKNLAFGELPKGWKPRSLVETAPEAAAAVTAPSPAAEAVAASSEAQASEPAPKEGKKRWR